MPSHADVWCVTEAVHDQHSTYSYNPDSNNSKIPLIWKVELVKITVHDLRPIMKRWIFGATMLKARKPAFLRTGSTKEIHSFTGSWLMKPFACLLHSYTAKKRKPLPTRYWANHQYLLEDVWWNKPVSRSLSEDWNRFVTPELIGKRWHVFPSTCAD